MKNTIHMKHIFLLMLFTILLLASCNNSSGNKVNYDNIDIYTQKPILFYDSVFSSLPGQLLVLDDYVVWIEARKANNFIHIIDKHTQEEIAAIGSIGHGPMEFDNPIVEKGEENKLILYDTNQKKQGTISIDSIKENKEYLTLNSPLEGEDVLRIKEISKNCYLLFSPISATPFSIHYNGQVYHSGELPIKEKLNIGSMFNYFQGEIKYNPQKEILLYTTFSFRYMALYKKNNNHFTLVKESREAIPDYTINKGELSLSNKHDTHVSEIALTKNYIVTAEYLENEKEEALKPHNIYNYVLPQSLFVYDYNLVLQKIIKLEKPIMRISSNSESDIVYAIIEDPDYKLVTISIDD